MPAANVSKYVDQRNHCPLGCMDAQLDEHGYCCHLVGFTNIGKFMETVSRNDRGRVCVGLGKQPVPKGAKLVNPERVVIDKATGTSSMAKEWVSFRVYVKVSDEEAEAWRQAHVSQFDPETAGDLADAI